MTEVTAGLTVKEGDPVSWQWSGSRPGGTVTEVKTDGPVTMETKRGNTVEKHGEEGNPAVYIEREGHDTVKKASEITVEKAGDKHKEDQGKMHTVTKEEAEKNHEPKTGDKRAAEEPAEEKKEDDAKKQKTDEAPKENGEKKRGRPAKGAGSGEKKPTKKREPKKAATADGKPRRSGRHAGKSS